MVVSFAVYALHLSWRTIHPPLARIFLDYEPGIHLSQLQMQAGVVGINTIRVYNPTKQITDQDADCRFIKRWIPELADFSATEIINCESNVLGSYPALIVDFKMPINFIDIYWSQTAKNTLNFFSVYCTRQNRTSTQQ